jgi:L-gulonolactone oxidase
VHTASATQNTDLFDAARTGVGALGIITSVTLQAIPLWKMRKTSFAYPLASLLDDLPDLLNQYERLQWSFEPYTDNATVVVREDVDWDTPIVPSGLDGGCWSEHQPTAEDCTDVSYKTLTDSLRHYDKRQLYTEMEMFIAVEDSVQAVRDYMQYMESIKHLHDPSVTLNVMLRYVAADDIMLSPMHGRDTAVISVIVLRATIRHAPTGARSTSRPLTARAGARDVRAPVPRPRTCLTRSTLSQCTRAGLPTTPS